MDALQGFGELGIGSRLKRLSEYMMKESQIVYDYYNIDFDPYLFPIYKIIANKNGVTNSEIKKLLNLSQPAITQAINKLLTKKLVEFKNDNLDKRKKIISLSKKGERELIKLKPVWESIESTVKHYTKGTSHSLIEHLNNLEFKFSETSLSSKIIENMKSNISTIEITNYDEKLKSHFYDLNIEWLETFFYVEDYDKEVLSKPETYIIDKGGFIFFAKYNNTVVGTVALMPMKEPSTFELTKMAVSPDYRGLKIGQKLMQHCIDFAKKHNSNALILYSSRKLENAIYIYRKYGFIEIPVEADCPYLRCDIKMELKL